MRSSRNFPLFIFSLLCGIVISGLFFSGRLLGSGWCVLSVDDAEDDRSVGELLSAAGFGDFYCESNQEFYIDDFGSLKAVALDRYPEMLESFDPRNDGYAEKLRSFFVRDGRRFFYIPLKDMNRPDKQLSGALGSLHFDVDFLGEEKDLSLIFILGGAALFSAFWFCRYKLRFAVQLPLLFAFLLSGPLGIVCAGLLTGLRLLLRLPLDELFTRRVYGTMKERFGPYKLHFLFAFFFLLFFTFLCFTGDMPAIPAATGLVFFMLIEILALKTEQKINRRIRFTPLQILPFQVKVPPLRLTMFPFVLAVLALIILPVLFPSFHKGNTSFAMDDFISPLDYERHMAFQLSFSEKPLGRDGGAYLNYYLGQDGLIAGTSSEAPPSRIETIAPFPLEKLRDFLIEYDSGINAAPFVPMEWISAAFLLIVCVPNYYRNGNGKNNGKKKAAFVRDRRIAA